MNRSLLIFLIFSFSMCATQYQNCVDEASFLKEFEHILRSPEQLSNDMIDIQAKKVPQGQNLEYYFNKGQYVSKGSFGRVNRVNIYNKNPKLYYSTPRGISFPTLNDAENFKNMKKVAGDMASEVAFKQISKPDPTSIHKTIFEREIGLQMKLNPTNATAKLYWCVETSTHLYLIMESLKVDLIAATSLATFQFLDLQTRLQKFTYIARLFEKMHNLGYSHEDLKPDNIMATDSDLNDFRIIDFGLSGKFGDSPIGGTPIYNRPFKFSIFETSKITHLNDIYGLALTFMVMESNETQLFAGIGNNCHTARFDSNCKKTLISNIDNVIKSRDLTIIKDILYRALEFTSPLFGSMKDFADALEGEYIKLKNLKQAPIQSTMNNDIIRQSRMVHEFLARDEIEKAFEANHKHYGKLQGDLVTPIYYEANKGVGVKEQKPDQNMIDLQLKHQQKVEEIKKQQQQGGKDLMYYSNDKQQIQQPPTQQPQAKDIKYYSNLKQPIQQPQVRQPLVQEPQVQQPQPQQPQANLPQGIQFKLQQIKNQTPQPLQLKVQQQVNKVGNYSNQPTTHYPDSGNNQPPTKKVIQIPVSNLPQYNLQTGNQNQNYNTQNPIHKRAASLSPHNNYIPQDAFGKPKQETIVSFYGITATLCPSAVNPVPVKFGHLCDTKDTPDSFLNVYSLYSKNPSYSQATDGKYVYFFTPDKKEAYVRMPITKMII